MHKNFAHNYDSTTDEQMRKLEFANIVKDIIVSDRRKEVDFYKKFVTDDNFQMSFIHSLRSLVDNDAVEQSN